MQVLEIIGNRLAKLKEDLGDALEARSMLRTALKTNESNLSNLKAAILELEALRTHLEASQEKASDQS